MWGRFRDSSEGRVCKGALNREESLAFALPRTPRLEVADGPRASLGRSLREDANVVSARMSAAVAERRVCALRTDLERAASPVELVAAIPAQPEHTEYVDETGSHHERRARFTTCP
jgi:hypothetical protein